VHSLAARVPRNAILGAIVEVCLGCSHPHASGPQRTPDTSLGTAEAGLCLARGRPCDWALLHEIYSAAVDCEPMPRVCEGERIDRVLLSSSIGGVYSLVFPEGKGPSFVGQKARIQVLEAREVSQAVAQKRALLAREFELRMLSRDTASIYISGRGLGRSACSFLMCGEKNLDLRLEAGRWVCSKAP
jgi:hypothetical protein